MGARYEGSVHNYISPIKLYVSSTDQAAVTQFLVDLGSCKELSELGYFTTGTVYKVDEDTQAVEYTLRLKLTEPITKDSFETEVGQ